MTFVRQSDNTTFLASDSSLYVLEILKRFAVTSICIAASSSNISLHSLYNCHCVTDKSISEKSYRTAMFLLIQHQILSWIIVERLLPSEHPTPDAQSNYGKFVSVIRVLIALQVRVDPLRRRFYEHSSWPADSAVSWRMLQSVIIQNE